MQRGGRRIRPLHDVASMQKCSAWIPRGLIIEDGIYLFLLLSAPPRDVVMYTCTPGGLLAAQRPLSASVSSSHTPPLLPGNGGKRG